VACDRVKPTYHVFMESIVTNSQFLVKGHIVEVFIKYCHRVSVSSRDIMSIALFVFLPSSLVPNLLLSYLGSLIHVS
jgi:hypothetical protein